jgi:uncharacterized protein (DUF1810 family)
MEKMSLGRFYEAQGQEGTYSRVLAELRGGRKQSHWMWFVFPQLAGLGHSPIAKYYALADLAEVRAYVADPVLGARLVECASALLSLDINEPTAVLGGVDAVKLRSSMTMFAVASPDIAVFQQVLDRFYGGVRDPRSEALLQAGGSDEWDEGS